jgi:uncharacterized protein (TIGR02646 family)
MIKLPATSLPDAAMQKLKNYQDYVDSHTTYADRVTAAKEEFRLKNVKNNNAFRSVRESLASMCRGAQRCMYCEDSFADEVEHYRPKDLYPELVFAWKNYLYSCGPCNGPKRNFFAIFAGPNGDVTELARGPKEKEPPGGHPLLIDPRNEDPLTLLRLDIQDTFRFQEVHASGTNEYARANYTIRVLHLNDREYLCAAREHAFSAFQGMLNLYVTGKAEGREQADLDRIALAIQRTHHPTVWAEMKRQRSKLQELNALFAGAPEVLDW